MGTSARKDAASQRRGVSCHDMGCVVVNASSASTFDGNVDL